MGAEVAGCGWRSIDQHHLNGNMTTRVLGSAPVEDCVTSSLLFPVYPSPCDSSAILGDLSGIHPGFGVIPPVFALFCNYFAVVL